MSNTSNEDLENEEREESGGHYRPGMTIKILYLPPNKFGVCQSEVENLLIAKLWWHPRLKCFMFFTNNPLTRRTKGYRMSSKFELKTDKLITDIRIIKQNEKGKMWGPTQKKIVTEYLENADYLETKYIAYKDTNGVEYDMPTDEFLGFVFRQKLTKNFRHGLKLDFTKDKNDNAIVIAYLRKIEKKEEK